MYCTNCGKELKEGEGNFCPYCGKKLNENAPYGAQPYARPVYRNPDDVPNGGWTVLGFFFPLVGLILYLVFQTNYPIRSKLCGKGALIGVIVDVGVSVLITVIYLIVFFSILASAPYSAALCLL